MTGIEIFLTIGILACLAYTAYMDMILAILVLEYFYPQGTPLR